MKKSKTKLLAIGAFVLWTSIFIAGLMSWPTCYAKETFELTIKSFCSRFRDGMEILEIVLPIIILVLAFISGRHEENQIAEPKKYNKFSILAFFGALVPPVSVALLLLISAINPPWAWLHGRGTYEYGKWFGYFMLFLTAAVAIFIPLVSILFGIISRIQIKKSGEKGKFVSLLSILISLLAIFGVLLSTFTADDVGFMW